MRNKELIDKRFMQIDGKLKTLKFLMSRSSTKEQFMDEIKGLTEVVDDLKSIIERQSTPLRNG
jgi:hypothetical protein|tara:strand:- start:52 stop:240 length:189 start_codon:yes stop_codon:yes gene_type:complete